MLSSIEKQTNILYSCFFIHNNSEKQSPSNQDLKYSTTHVVTPDFFFGRSKTQEIL